MWKFQDFSATQIFREIHFCDFRKPNIAILAHLKALNFDFYEFLQFPKTDIDPN